MAPPGDNDDDEIVDDDLIPIPDDDDDYIIIPDDANDEVPEDYDPYEGAHNWGYDGLQYNNWVRINTNFLDVHSVARAYTEVNGGYIKFGEDYGQSGTTVRCTLKPATYSSYKGFEIDGSRIDIDTGRDTDIYDTYCKIEVGNDAGLTGYLKAVSKIRVVAHSEPTWEVIELPFICGICVADSSQV